MLEEFSVHQTQRSDAGNAGPKLPLHAATRETPWEQVATMNTDPFGRYFWQSVSRQSAHRKQKTKTPLHHKQQNHYDNNIAT